MYGASYMRVNVNECCKLKQLKVTGVIVTGDKIDHTY